MLSSSTTRGMLCHEKTEHYCSQLGIGLGSCVVSTLTDLVVISYYSNSDDTLIYTYILICSLNNVSFLSYMARQCQMKDMLSARCDKCI